MCNGTCEYVADRDQPETWHGEDPEDWYPGDDPDEYWIDGDSWSCPHDMLEESDENYCVFHTEPEDVPEDVDERNLLVSAIEEAIEAEEGSEVRRKAEFVGAMVGDLMLNELSSGGEDLWLRFDHAVFRGVVTSSSTIHQSISFFGTNCEFDILFKGITFKQEAEFEGMTFEGNADFEGATFKGATFKGTTFEGNAEFDGATFEGNAEFEATTAGGTPFEGNAEFEGTTFDGTTFEGDAWFGETTFEGDAWFKGTTFERYAWFKGAMFDGDAKFEEATFEGRAGFNKTTFEGNAIFHGATFAGNAEFNLVAFEGNAMFNWATVEGTTVDGTTFEMTSEEATFEGNAMFHGATFEGNAMFHGATFEGGAGFNETTFEGRAGFKGTTFERYAWFKGAMFDGNVSFDEATLKGDARFSDSDFVGGGLSGKPEWPSTTTFEKANFTDTDLTDASLAGTDLTGAKFSRATLYGTDFNEAKLDGTIFGEAQINERTNFGQFASGTDEPTEDRTSDATGGDDDGATAGSDEDEREGDEGSIVERADDQMIERPLRVVYDPFAGPEETANETEDSFVHRFKRVVSFKRVVNRYRYWHTASWLNGTDDLTDKDERSESESEHATTDGGTTRAGPHTDTHLRKAATTYHLIENLARYNSLPRLQSQAFVRRQEMHRLQYAKKRQFSRWLRASAARATLLYGESPWRVIGASLSTILLFGMLYPLGGFRDPGSGEIVQAGSVGEWLATLPDGIYFSTLTFTTLGFGDFQPVSWGKWLATTETALGATLIALLVFVLGRRAAR